MRLNRIWIEYKGYHQAPDAENGAPLYDLQNIYPDDIYSLDGARIYGTGDAYDERAIMILRQARGRPNYPVKVYRAIPKVITKQQHIQDLTDQKKYILRYGKVPPRINTHMDTSEYYEYLSDEIEKITKSDNLPDKVQINPGDWVTISREYAVLHGKSSLKGIYRVLTKTVRAKDLYTEGNSLHEWGYFPTK